MFTKWLVKHSSAVRCKLDGFPQRPLAEGGWLVPHVQPQHWELSAIKDEKTALKASREEGRLL